MKKILVTGGAGYIGSHTVVELVRNGYEPIIVDHFGNSNPKVFNGVEKIIGQKITFYEVDILDKKALSTVFKEHAISGVIHFAAWKAVGESVDNPLKYYANNVGGIIALLEVCQEFNVQSFVFSSSCTVYGIPDSMPASEKSPIKPANSPYGNTKQIGEEIIQDLHRSNPQFGALLLRYFNPIGAHPTGLIGELPLGTPNNLVPFITQTAIGKRERLTVFGKDYETPDGTCIRDYIHVVDLAEAHVKALRLIEDNPGVLDVMNIGTGKGNSVMEVIKAFEQVSGLQLPVEYGERRSGDVPAIYAENSKAQKHLNWSPTFSLLDAMEHAWKWEQNLNQ